MHAIRAGIRTTLGSFSKIKNNRDMILTVPLIVDWTAIVTMKRKHLVNKRNSCKEKNCNQQHEYAQNQMQNRQMTSSPYLSTKVHKYTKRKQKLLN